MDINAPGGIKFPNITTGATATQGASATPTTPTEILDSLKSKIVHPVSDSTMGFLKVLADGAIPEHLSSAANVGQFNWMIHAGNCDLFVAAFDLYHDLQSKAWTSDDMPYKRTLVLKMPVDWAPAPNGALEQALRQARIERLIVEPYDHLFPGQWQAVTYDPVSAATCKCIATVLNAGATDLIIGGPLEDPEAIATAISTSQLRWFAVTKLLYAHIDDNDVESYRQIMAALCTCPTLKHLSIAEAELVTLHPIISSFQQLPNGPKLVSVGLGLSGDPRADAEIEIDGHNAHHFLAFMEVVSKIPTLSVFRVRSVEVRDAESLATNILNPLAKSRTLTQLDFRGKISSASSSERVFASQKITAFMAACPSLLHITLNLGSPDVEGGRTSDWAGHAIHAHLQDHDDFEHAFAAESMAFTAAAANGTQKLQSLSFRGLHIPPTIATAIVGIFVDNTSLVTCDLLDCYLPLLPLAGLPAALKHNSTIKFIWLPQNLANYHLVITSNGTPIAVGFGFSTPPALNVSLRFPPDTAPEVMEEAKQSIPHWQQMGRAFFQAALGKPHENRRAPFVEKAQGESTASVQAFMSSALQSAPHNGRPAQADLFSLAAQSFVKHLSDERQLKSAIRLSEINMATRMRPDHPEGEPYAPGDDLRTVVDYFDSGQAVAENRENMIQSFKTLPDLEDFRDEVVRVAPLPLQSPQAVHMQHKPLSGASGLLYAQAWKYIAEHDVDGLVSVLKQGTPVNVVDDSKRKNELLMLAVATGEETLVRALLEHDAIDFGGHAEINAPHHVALEFKPKVHTATTTTTADITTTNTTTTTTTTATTSTTGTSTRTTPTDGDSGGTINTMQ